ncbi:MAG: enoyl-CoA hydratase/isomerase family protein [Pseudomonadota bacterium]
MSGRVDLETRGAVAIVRFSNPPEGFMDEGTEAGLTEALERIEGDDAVRAAVLTGADPGVFIRHYDVRVLEARGRALRDKGYEFDTARPVPETAFHAALRRIETSAKPYIAAINGTAMGGGFELALACDIRLAEAGEHWLGLPEANIGLLPGAGGTQRLTALIGQGRALEMMLMGRTVRPEEAAQLGVVSACVQAPVLDPALAMAGRLAAQPVRALAHIKRLVRAGGASEGWLEAERTLFCDLMVSEESIGLMHRMNTGSGDIRDP